MQAWTNRLITNCKSKFCRMKLAIEDPSTSSNRSWLKCYMDSALKVIWLFQIVLCATYPNCIHNAQFSFSISTISSVGGRNLDTICQWLSCCLLIECTEQLYLSDHLIAKAKVMHPKKNYSSSFLSCFLSTNYSSTLRMCDSWSRTPYVSPITCKQ
jgi:hypothetical protein